MTEHYFSKSPQAKSSPMTWESTLRGRKYQFTTDFGVFSKDRIDFGTRLLIESYIDSNVDGPLLDLGCGYGPIGISLSKKREVVMVDINERAVELAKENIRQNNIEVAEVFQSDGFEKLEDYKFAVILTNPPIRAGKKKIYSLFSEAKKHLLPKGELWIVIRKKQGALSAKKELEKIYPIVETIERKKGFHILKAVSC